MHASSSFVGAVLAIAATAASAAPELSPDATLTRIAFGSCAKESSAQPIWDAVLAADPELFVLLGDNVYLDTRDPAVMREKYARFSALPGFARLRERVPVLATWDDHDYGENDAGAEYPLKQESRRQFLDFFGVAQDSPRRSRDGIYESYNFGSQGQRVQLILLDLRWNRTPITVDPRWGSYEAYEDWAKQQDGSQGPVPGPYTRNPDAGATMLGEAQWRWLEQRLKEPADLRLIGSSLQVLADFPGWEAWVNYVEDQQRLFELIRATNAGRVVFLSGDTHYGELSVQTRNVPYPLHDLTSSGLTEVWRVPVPNARRVGPILRQANFGLLEIDWQRQVLRLGLRDERGGTLLEHELNLDALRP
jgi:alkaline phosphatase D